MQSNSSTITTNDTTTRRRRLGRIVGTTIAATAALTTLGAAGHATAADTDPAVACYYPGFTGGVHVAVGDWDGDGHVDAGDLEVWKAQFGSSKWFVADSFSFGVEREMKESGEKAGTEDINIGIGELQECNISESSDASTSDAGEQTYLAVELENVQITSYQLGVLDAADDVRVSNFGQSAEADFNGDGVVDGDDFLAWQRGAAADKGHGGWVIIQSISLPIHR